VWKIQLKKNREECMLMGGDFNGRIGERGARNWKEGGDGKRKSKGGRCRGEMTEGMNRRK
jgi:hypothetical protein